MRKIVIVLVGLLISAVAHANFKESYYMGLAGGTQFRKVRPNYLGTFPLVSDEHTTLGLGARIYAGYQYNEWTGLELGYGKYFDNRYRVTWSYTNVPPFNSTVKGTSVGDIVEQGFDLVAKFVFPIAEGWNVFGKIGAAYIHQEIERPLLLPPPTTTFPKTPPSGPNQNHRTTKQMVMGTYGLGVGYDMEDTRVEVGVTQFNTSDAFPNLDFAYIGIHWYFF